MRRDARVAGVGHSCLRRCHVRLDPAAVADLATYSLVQASGGTIECYMSDAVGSRGRLACTKDPERRAVSQPFALAMSSPSSSKASIV